PAASGATVSPRRAKSGNATRRILSAPRRCLLDIICPKRRRRRQRRRCATFSPLSSRRRWFGQEIAQGVKQQVPVLAVAGAVRGLRKDDELAIAVRQLSEEVE